MKNVTLLIAMTFVTDYFANPTWRQDFINSLTFCQQRHMVAFTVNKLPARHTEWEKDQISEKGRKFAVMYPKKKGCRR